MRDAIVYAGSSWETFNVPERIAMALARLGCKVLHCEGPVSVLRTKPGALREVGAEIHSLRVRFVSSRLNSLPGASFVQARILQKQIEAAGKALGLHDPIFLYAWMGQLLPLCAMMKRNHFIVHICMDHSVVADPHYGRYVEIADKTLVVPRSCYHKFKARYGERICLIPQSGNLREIKSQAHADPTDSGPLSSVPKPRLGYLGPLSGRVNTTLITSVLRAHPEWHFVSMGPEWMLPLPNAHVVPWAAPAKAETYAACLDVGFMPYDCYDEQALHCVPLKMFDYFAYGIPVVSTPAVHLWEYRDLIHFGDTAEELADGVKAALNEPSDSPKRAARIEVAREHSIENLAKVLQACLPLEPGQSR